jgi:hypothetical protein
VNHLAYIDYGIATARRGWAEKADVVNTLPVDKFLRSLKGRTHEGKVKARRSAR